MSNDRKNGIFNFSKSDIVLHMIYEMELCIKMKEAFNYLEKNLIIQNPVVDLQELKWDKGKNYDWAMIRKGDITFIIRKYSVHFTIFIKYKKKEIVDKFEDIPEFTRSKYGCFTFSTDREKIENYDNYCDNNFIDLNNHINDIFKLIKKNHIHLLWNNAALKRPNYVEIKNIWNGGEDIQNIDQFIFCCEEIFGKYLEIFSEKDMLDKIKTLSIGDKIGEYEILSVETEVKDNYYHSAGLTLKGTNGKNSKSFCDVYSLSRYYYKNIFG